MCIWIGMKRIQQPSKAELMLDTQAQIFLIQRSGKQSMYVFIEH